MSAPHGNRLRIGRASEPGRVYLVTTVTAQRRPLFTNFERGRLLVNALRWSDQQQRTVTWAFVVMPDHLHWLFALGGAESSLSRVVESVKKFAARAINKTMDTDGRVWQPGFHDHALRAEENLRDAARYVVMNPVRSGLVRSIAQWPLWDARWVGRV
jgi:putative transposase